MTYTLQDLINAALELLKAIDSEHRGELGVDTAAACNYLNHIINSMTEL